MPSKYLAQNMLLALLNSLFNKYILLSSTFPLVTTLKKETHHNER
jgi:hypothetical protein